jgi:hypothetical protein
MPELAVQLLRKIYGSRVTAEHEALLRTTAVHSASARELHQGLEAMRFLFK